jgi:hypothetical protein|tara:strand:+ start:720 stop:983 length:264 start_codon:yes stop_codon:yes gene_type:complete
MAKSRPCLPKGKMSRQKSKMLMRSGGELDEIMMNSVVEKMNYGGNAQRVVRDTETGIESKQAYKLGGGTHNTYSGPSKAKGSKKKKK